MPAAKIAPTVVGEGSASTDLAPRELRQILEQALLHVAPDARVLAIIPDKTRDDNTDLLFPFAAEILSERGVAKYDALVAQGTHPPMAEDEKRSKIGLAHGTSAGVGEIFDHQWNIPDELTTIGELSATDVSRLTVSHRRQPAAWNHRSTDAPSGLSKIQTSSKSRASASSIVDGAVRRSPPKTYSSSGRRPQRGQSSHSISEYRPSRRRPAHGRARSDPA